MGTTARFSIAAGLLLLGCVIPASAQRSGTRQGFWFGFGFGYGSANVSCDNCVAGSRIDGTSGFLRIGGTLNPHVLLGAAVDGWSHSSGGNTETLGNLTASVSYYPQTRSGLFLEGGAGLSDYRVDTSPAVTGTGWGVTAGIGYDIPVSRTVSLTPRAAYAYGAVGNLNYSGGGLPFTTGWKQDVLSLGLGLTFHRPRR
jgi:hypothetical protein